MARAETSISAHRHSETRWNCLLGGRERVAAAKINSTLTTDNAAITVETFYDISLNRAFT